MNTKKGWKTLKKWKTFIVLTALSLRLLQQWQPKVKKIWCWSLQQSVVRYRLRCFVFFSLIFYVSEPFGTIFYNQSGEKKDFWSPKGERFIQMKWTRSAAQLLLRIPNCYKSQAFVFSPKYNWNRRLKKYVYCLCLCAYYVIRASARYWVSNVFLIGILVLSCWKSGFYHTFKKHTVKKMDYYIPGLLYTWIIVHLDYCTPGWMETGAFLKLF